MRVMTALKYFRMMEKKTGKKDVLHNSSKSPRSTFDTIPSISIKRQGPCPHSFGQRYVLEERAFYAA